MLMVMQDCEKALAALRQKEQKLQAQEAGAAQLHRESQNGRQESQVPQEGHVGQCSLLAYTCARNVAAVLSLDALKKRFW